MHTIHFPNPTELKKNKTKLERALQVNIQINNKEATISSEDATKEYEASLVLEAIAFGFSTEKALPLKNQDMVFQILPIKSISRRKNLEEVRSRIIGRNGKTKETVEEITQARLHLNHNQLGFIAHTENLQEITTALTNLIQGSKQTNTYRFLEAGNRRRKKANAEERSELSSKRPGEDSNL